MRYIRTALTLSSLALAVTTAVAQSGGLTIQVLDDKGLPLPGAIVTISHATGSVKTTAAETDAKGFVEFPVLLAGGGYTVKVSFSGFSEIIKDDIRVKMGDSQTIQIKMFQEIQEHIKVIAKSEVIDLAQSEASTKFSDEFISDLPVPGRLYQNVLTLAPGVQDPDGDGNPIVHGSRERDFRMEVGGVANVDPLTGQQFMNINPNSIEEMEVITAGAGVEFGRAQGGFGRIIQKQGSNEHEGVVEFYYRTSKIDGAGARDNSNLPDPDFNTYQPSVQFSGPIVKDKLWYRLSHEMRNIQEPIIGGAAVQTTRERTHSDQITWQASPRNKLAFQFQANPRVIDNFGVSNFIPAESALRRKNSGDIYSLTWTAPYSPKILISSGLHWQDLNFALLPNSEGVQNDCISTIDFLAQSRCFDTDSGRISGSFFQTWDDHRQRLTATSEATVYGGRFWGMSHEFKMGFEVENERYFRNLIQRSDVTLFIIRTPADKPGGETTPEAFGLAFAALAIPPEDEMRAVGTSWGFFGQDQIKPLQNLTLTFGVRMDREEINSQGMSNFDPVAEYQQFQARCPQCILPGNAAQGRNEWAGIFTGYEAMTDFITAVSNVVCTGITDPQQLLTCQRGVASSIPLQPDIGSLAKQRQSRDINLANMNFSPALSVAWDPWSNGKSAFKASMGRHYNNIPLRVPFEELAPVTTFLAYRVNLANQEANIDQDISPAPNLSTVDRNLQTPYQDELLFSYERELWTETRLTLSYVNRKYRDQIQDVNINRALGDYGVCDRVTSPGSTPVIASPGSGFTVTDPYSHESYVDTNPGPGDGRMDDCIGEIAALPRGDGSGGGGGKQNANDFFLAQQPDGVLDLYVQNPFWGDIFLVGNFNQHDYEALSAELVRRQYRSWELSGSYVYSKAKGNGEDFFQDLGDDPSTIDDEYGYQSTDQRHVAKVSATTVTPWGVRLGTSVSWQSGLPYSLVHRKFSVTAIPPDLALGFNPQGVRTQYTTGVRNDQRNESYWLVDAKATKEFNLGRSMTMSLTAEIYNLFNDDTYRVYNGDLGRGWQVNGNNEFETFFGRQWQLGMKLAF